MNNKKTNIITEPQKNGNDSLSVVEAQVIRHNQLNMFNGVANPNDLVYTPKWVAEDMIKYFNPTGKILEPCKGRGAIFDLLDGDKHWCEIMDGKDFYEYRERVDWIISNPPFSIFRQFLAHSFDLADNIVFLAPLNKLFNPFGQLKELREYGWVKHIRIYGTGTRLNFPMGNAVGAMHFCRNYKLRTTFTFCGV